MVCAKCQKQQKQTQLATPGIKRRSEVYYGSSTSASSAGKQGKPSATLGQTGIGKNKLLSKAAKNPYAAYASSCKTCKTKIEQGRTYCLSCSYKANACAGCGKTNAAKSSGAITIDGQKRSAK